MDTISLLLGITVVQLLYLLLYFIMMRRREFFYYFLFVAGIYTFLALKFIPGIFAYLNFLGVEHVVANGYGILLIAMSMYYRFARYFIQAHTLYPAFNRNIRLNEQVILVTAACFIAAAVTGFGIDFIKYVALGVYLANFLIQLYVFYFLIRTGITVNYILVAGTIFASILFKRSVAGDALALGEVGISRSELSNILLALVVDMLVINFAMIYNSRVLDRARILAKLERERALFQQREEISNDLHDDLGASLSSIQVYTGLAQKAAMQGGDGSQLDAMLDKVSNGIRSISERLNDVVWAVNANVKEGKSISSRIKDFYVDLFDAREIDCTYDIDPAVESRITDVNVRKSLLMIAKEAINNAVKHSGARRLRLAIGQEGDMLRLAVEDDGKGIPETVNSMGNGFHSMSQRARRLGGSLKTMPADGGGTCVECRIPMTRISD